MRKSKDSRERKDKKRKSVDKPDESQVSGLNESGG